MVFFPTFSFPFPPLFHHFLFSSLSHLISPLFLPFFLFSPLPFPPPPSFPPSFPCFHFPPTSPPLSPFFPSPPLAGHSLHYPGHIGVLCAQHWGCSHRTDVVPTQWGTHHHPRDRGWGQGLGHVPAGGWCQHSPQTPQTSPGQGGGPSLSCDARCPNDFGIEVGVHRSISHHSHWAQGSWESGCGECWKLWEQGGGGFPLLLMDAPHLQVSVGPGESQQLCSIKVSSGRAQWGGSCPVPCAGPAQG